MIDIIYKGFPFKPETGCFGIGSAFLIKGEKNILFDTGSYGARSEIIRLLDNKLIDIVVISHLHFDHVSNLDLFINNKSIEIYISEIEYEQYNLRKNIDYDLFSYFDLIKDKLNIKLFSNTLELFDNIKIISTPGHTLGHSSLVINDNIIFAGDAIKTYNDFKNINNYGNAVDKNKYIKTKKLIIDKYPIIYCGHDGVIKNNLLYERGEINEF